MAKWKTIKELPDVLQPKKSAIRGDHYRAFEGQIGREIIKNGRKMKLGGKSSKMGVK